MYWNVPIIKPKKPIHAETRCNKGLSNALPNFSPILSRKDMRVKVTKKTMEKERATAMKAPAEAVGADNTRRGALPGRADKSG